MNILFVGDIVGACGRNIFLNSLPEIRLQENIDAVIVNGENAAHGRGISQNISDAFFDAGVDVITMGNHVWNNNDIFKIFQTSNRVIRPANLPESNPGSGSAVFEAKGEKVGVINLIGRVFMEPCDSPFYAAKREIVLLREQGCNIIIVDMHAEATSEKIAMGWYLDGSVSAVVGTHTHVQSADEKILPKGSAYITDVGMTGPYYSVIGTKRQIIIERFTTGLPQKFEVADGGGQFNGVIIDIDEQSGKSNSIKRISFTDF